MLNRTILMGRLTRDPELRKTASGTSVTSYSIAVQRDYGNKETDFIDIVAWDKKADFAVKHFRKGMLVAVDGKLKTRSWDDKDGNKHKAVEVEVDAQYFAEGKGNAELEIAPGVAVPIDIDDDLPWETSGDDDLLF